MNNKKLAVINLILLFSIFLLADKCMALPIESPKPPLLEATEKSDMNKLKPVLNSTQGFNSMEWKGYLSDQKEKFVKAVVNKVEWDELWKRAFNKPGPEVDFENYVVACVFLGHGADWLYDIWFNKPYERDNLLVIPFSLAEIILKLSGPFKASGQYHMKVFKKRNGFEMILEDTSGSLRRM
ncbi:MAG: hypothetical protein C0399_04095 [Syntrophus sp. (in: bacteria)]|nr:hypothetical protein [Syntrophus sp. (in: bacteria)]